jgi:hypothetical protein
MRKTMCLGAFLGVLAATPAFAGIYNTESCFRGSTYDGDPRNVAGKGTCNKGHYIRNTHNPNRFIHGPGVVVRH